MKSLPLQTDENPEQENNNKGTITIIGKKAIQKSTAEEQVKALEDKAICWPFNLTAEEKDAK